MDKKSNLTISILCIIEIICCFTPFCLDKEYWEYKQALVYHGISSLERRSNINIFGVDATLGKPFAVLFICMAIAVAVIYFIKMLDYTLKITNYAWIFAFTHTAIMAIFLVYSCSIAEVDRVSYRYEYSINWMSYIIITINIITLVLAILLKMGKVDKALIKKPEIAKQQKESVDELFAYKELLDSGVISQEEFELKKKQILGL